MISTVDERAQELIAKPALGRGKALIFGCESPTLTAAVALELARQGTEVLIVDEPTTPMFNDSLAALSLASDGRIHQKSLAAANTPAQTLQSATRLLEGLDIVVNLYAPMPGSDRPEVLDYPRQLLDRSLVAAEVLVAQTKRGSIVSQCFLPAIYAGTSLEDLMPAVKGAVTGVTRTLCRRYAHRGLRANYVQTGLIDLPELKPTLSTLVRGLTVPVGRWGTAEDVAALIAFFAIEDHYMTGQVVLLDGGLTAGLTGT